MYKDKKCVNCLNLFTPVNSSEKRCDKCKYVACKVCGKVFKSNNVSIVHRKDTYCSKKCYAADRWKDRRPILTTHCQYCNNLISFNTERIPQFCNKSCALRFRWSNPDTKERISKRISSDPYHSSDKKKKQLEIARTKRKFSPETREKIRQARLKQTFPTKMTGIERKLSFAFRWLNLTFTMHKTMFNRWQPDFVFENEKIIVQADGDYWHSLPKTQISDENFNRMAIDDGWKVIRFSETKINLSLKECIIEVLEALSKAQNQLLSIPNS